jgi:hypothetical protein
MLGLLAVLMRKRIVFCAMLLGSTDSSFFFRLHDVLRYIGRTIQIAACRSAYRPCPTVTGGPTMQLALTDSEAEILRDLLHAYLPELEREVARTDRHSLRHVLVQRQNLAERLLEQLASPSGLG